MSRSDGERIRIGRMGAMAGAVLEVALSGPRGEPVDLWRTIVSHGVADLPPGTIDESARTYETTLPLGRTRPRTIRIREGGRGKALVDVLGPPLSEAGRERITRAVRRMLNLDEDLSAFYEVASADSQLSWAVDGAGRMLRSPTVFEDVVKTLFPLSESAGSAGRSNVARFGETRFSIRTRSGLASRTSTRMSNRRYVCSRVAASASRRIGAKSWIMSDCSTRRRAASSDETASRSSAILRRTASRVSVCSRTTASISAASSAVLAAV